MKYLKKFNELFEGARQIYNKKAIIEIIISHMKIEKEFEDDIRKELIMMHKNEFDDIAEQIGLKKLGNGFWIVDN
jgi:hypothetical protein